MNICDQTIFNEDTKQKFNKERTVSNEWCWIEQVSSL